MRMGVDQARNNDAAGAIHDLTGGVGICNLVGWPDSLDHPSPNSNRARVEEVEIVDHTAEEVSSAAKVQTLTDHEKAARVRALATLAPLLVEHEQLLADAMADAYTITNPMEKVSALIAMVPYLPAGEPMARTVQVILAGMPEITVEYRRARALTSLAPQLEGQALAQGLEIAMAIADPYDRATTLLALLPQLAEADQPDILDHIWESAREILDDYDRASALATLWPLAPADIQPAIAQAVLDAVKEIDDDYDRASGISVFAPLLVSNDMPSVLPAESQVLREALVAACQIPRVSERAAVLTQVLPYWLKAHPPKMVYALWCEVLSLLSRRPVAHLLHDLAVLAPLFESIGGKHAAEEVAQTIATARQW